MFSRLKALKPVPQLLTLALCVLASTSLEAANNRWNARNYERGAWGGNGGWWGDSRSDWYGDHGTPEEHDYFGNYTTPRSHPYRHYQGYYDGYYSPNQYPFHGVYYGDSVDGAGIYFNIR